MSSTKSLKTASAAPPPPDPICILRGHDSEVTSVRFYPFESHSQQQQQKLLFSGSSSGSIRIWDVARRRTIASINNDTDQPMRSVLNLDFLNDHVLVSQRRSGLIQLWDLNHSSIGSSAGRRVEDESSPYTTVQTYHFYGDVPFNTFCKCSLLRTPSSSGDGSSSSDGSVSGGGLLAVPSQELSEAWVYDLRDMSSGPMHSLSVEEEKTGMCTSLELFEDDVTGCSYLYGGFENGGVYCWDLRNTSQPLLLLLLHSKLHTEPVLSICSTFTRDKKKKKKKTKQVFNTLGEDEARGVEEEEEGKEQEPSSGAYPKRIRRTITGSGDSVVCVSDWDLVGNNNNNSDNTEENNDDNENSAGGRGGGGGVRILARTEIKNNGISDIAIRRGDNRIFATAGWDHRVRIFEFSNISSSSSSKKKKKKEGTAATATAGRPLAILKYHTGSVYCVDFSPRYDASDADDEIDRDRSSSSNNNKERAEYLLASGSKDKRIAIWSIYQPNNNNNNISQE